MENSRLEFPTKFITNEFIRTIPNQDTDMVAYNGNAYL